MTLEEKTFLSGFSVCEMTDLRLPCPHSLLPSPNSHSLLSSQPSPHFLLHAHLVLPSVTVVYGVWTKLNKGNLRKRGVACVGEMSVHGGLKYLRPVNESLCLAQQRFSSSVCMIERSCRAIQTLNIEAWTLEQHRFSANVHVQSSAQTRPSQTSDLVQWL